mgnify:CR=1 FL=1
MVLGQPGPVLTPLHAGVLGSPIDHSLSPTLHRAGYEATGLADWRYTAHEVDEGGLAPFVTGLDVMWRGLSLTMPLKVAAFDVAEELGEGRLRVRLRVSSEDWLVRLALRLGSSGRVLEPARLASRVAEAARAGLVGYDPAPA